MKEQQSEQQIYKDDYVFKKGDKIGNYQILSEIDPGEFGQVVKCFDLRDKKKTYVAKISKSTIADFENGKIEVEIL